MKYLIITLFISSSLFAGEISKYKRDLFGPGWKDFDGDCKSTRHEILTDFSTITPLYKSSKQCRVVRGRWISMYTGDIHTKARVLDIDHIVPVAWAWYHGANEWDTEARIAFYNDPANLIAVEAKLNRQKSAKGPDKWLPPKNQCQYFARFLRIVKKYKLSLSEREFTEYKNKLNHFRCI